MAVRDGDSSERCAAEREKRASLHIVDLRHRSDRRVVNNSNSFCLPATDTPVIS